MKPLERYADKLARVHGGLADRRLNAAAAENALEVGIESAKCAVPPLG